jgi:hypothetical protein
MSWRPPGTASEYHISDYKLVPLHKLRTASSISIQHGQRSILLSDGGIKYPPGYYVEIRFDPLVVAPVKRTLNRPSFSQWLRGFRAVILQETTKLNVVTIGAKSEKHAHFILNSLEAALEEKPFEVG